MPISQLNHPHRILGNLCSLAQVIEKVDQVLGEQRFTRFSFALSSLFWHAELEEGTLASTAPDRQVGAQACANLIMAATEFQTAWNAVRIGNVPASHRQGRVACEFVGIAALYGFDEGKLRRLDNRKIPLIKHLRESPAADVRSLLCHTVDHESGQVRRAKLEARGAYKSFLLLTEELLDMETEIAQFREYQRWHQHSMSHGDPMTSAYHFEGFRPGKNVGALFDPERIPTYREGADRIIEQIEFMLGILERIVKYRAEDPLA